MNNTIIINIKKLKTNYVNQS